LFVFVHRLVFQWEMAPVTVPGARGGAPTIVVDDEELGSVKFEKFATMSPAFDKVKGTITAANASKLRQAFSI
jgi:acetyl-CoA C-acetyltransferase